jgi:hypothetical protein
MLRILILIIFIYTLLFIFSFLKNITKLNNKLFEQYDNSLNGGQI